MKSWLTLFFFRISYISFSQALKPGYIVETTGDTLKGFLEYRQSASKTCAFTKDINSKTKNYSATEILAYGYDNDLFFRSLWIKTEVNFVEVVVSGKASLVVNENCFGVVKDSSLILLEPKYRDTKVNQTWYKVEDRTAIARLATLLSDCKENLNFEKVTIYNTKPSVQQKKLSELVERYNKCHGGTSIKTTNKTTDKGVIELSGFIGLTSPTMDNKTGSDYYRIKNFELRKGIQFGVLAQLSHPRVSEKLSFLTGVYYHQISGDCYFTSDRPFSSAPVSFTELKFPFGIRYQFTRTRIVPYAKIGGAIATLLDQEHPWNMKVKYNNMSFFYAAGATTKIADHQFISIELGRDTGPDISRGTGLSLNGRFPYLATGYTYRF